MFVTPHLENSVFQSGGLCSLPLPSPYLHTDISHAWRCIFLTVALRGCGCMLFCPLQWDHLFLALLS